MLVVCTCGTILWRVGTCLGFGVLRVVAPVLQGASEQLCEKMAELSTCCLEQDKGIGIYRSRFSTFEMYVLWKS